MVVFQWERLPARNARFLPSPGSLRQCTHQSNPISGAISQSTQIHLGGRVSSRLRRATRPWRALAPHHSDRDKKCVAVYKAPDSIYKADLTVRTPTFEAPLSTAPLPRLPTR